MVRKVIDKFSGFSSHVWFKSSLGNRGWLCWFHGFPGKKSTGSLIWSTVYNWSKYRDLSGFDIFWFLDRTSRMQGALDRTIDMSDIRRLYAVNAFAQTPLHCAASSGSSAVVQDGNWRFHGSEWIENIRWSCCEIGVVPELDTRVSLFWGHLK